MPALTVTSPVGQTGGTCSRQVTLLLAHGAGAPMDSPFLEGFADLLAACGITVVRFEFAFMAARRTTGKRRPAPKAETLTGEYLAAVEALQTQSALPHGTLLIGGKSLGGRVASLVAAELYTRQQVAGLICLGYPFHPPRKPDRLRTAHLADLVCPTLIVQGEADPLGTRAEVESYSLSPGIQWHWLAQADHDLVPKASPGVTKAQARDAAWREAADAITAFAAAF